MITELLAISTAFFFGSTAVCTKKALEEDVNYLVGALLATFLSFFVLWAVFFSLPIGLSEKLDLFRNQGVLFFALSGLLAPGAGLLLVIVGIKRGGVTISEPIMGTKPLFAIIAAVFLLGEDMVPQIAIGVLLIVFGIAMLSQITERINIMVPLLSAISFGIGLAIRKMAILLLDSPIFGAAVSTSTALGLYLFFTLLIRGRGKKVSFSLDGRSFAFFSGAGFCMSMAYICLFSALNLGDVSIVAPLSSLSPIFALFLSYLFLRKTEKITWQKIAGGIFVLLGAVLIIVLQ